jgi:hypothetical protein
MISTLIDLRDCIKAAGSLRIDSDPVPVRAAAIADHLLRLVKSGYFEQRPHADEQITALWLTRAIAELDELRTVNAPTEVLDRLDALIVELPELSVAGSQ